jgi:hypothetical protein
MVGYYHLNFFPIKIYLLEESLSLVLYKIDCLVLKFQSPLLKPKLNLLN